MTAEATAAQRRRRARRALWIGASLLLGLALWLGFLAVIDVRWTAAIGRAAAIEAELAGRDGRRPVLYGEATQGDAFDEYLAAIRAASTWSRSLADDEETANAARAASAEGAASAVLAALRRGAHRADATLRLDWNDPASNARLPDVAGCIACGHLAVGRFERLHAAGDDLAAVETLLDAAQLGRDLMHAPVLLTEIVGAAILQCVLDDGLDGARIVSLSPAALAQLDEALAILDASLDVCGVAERGEVLWAARMIESMDGSAFHDAGLLLRAWRHGFSRRLMFADAIDELLDAADDASARRLEPWLARRSAVELRTRRLSASQNSITKLFGVDQGEAMSQRLASIAKLRMLRQAVRARLGREHEALADPFGTELRSAVAGGRARFWSVGPDAVDDGGSAPADLVLDLPWPR